MRPWLPLLLLPLASCAKLGELAKIVNAEDLAPTVSFKKVTVDDVGWTGADATFLFQVDNPNPLDIALSSFTYDLDIDGRDLVAGVGDDGLELPARGSAEVSLPASLVFSELLELASSSRSKDTVPFTVAGSFGFDTPLGEISIPYEASGTLPVLRPPTFELEAFRVGSLNIARQTATLELDLGVTNAQATNALSFSNFAYDIALSGTEVASSRIASLGTVGAGETETVTLPIEVNLLELGSSVVRAITERSRLQVGLDASVDVDTPLGSIPLRIDESGRLELQ